MKKLIIKFICVIIVTATVFSFSTSANNFEYCTYDEYASLENVRLIKRDNTAYLVGFKGKTAYIDIVHPHLNSVSISLLSNISFYNIFNDKAIFFCNNYDNNQTDIVIYDINRDTFEYITLNKTHISSSNDFTYANNHLYILISDKEVLIFNNDGTLYDTMHSDISMTSLFIDGYQNVYATATNAVLKASNNGFVKIYNKQVFPQITLINKNVFIDNYGTVFQINGNNINALNNFKSNTYYTCGAQYKDYFVTSNNSTFYARSTSDNGNKKLLNMPYNIQQFCMIDETLITFCNQNKPIVYFASFSDFSDITTNQSNNQSTSNGKISSDVYVIDNTNHTISQIPHSTTVAKFKQNMNFDGYKVEFVRYDGKVITSGNVGTGTAVKFYNDKTSYKYQLSVIGDLTGEGNVNSRDKKMIMRAAVGSVVLEGVYYESANLHTKYSEIDVCDAIMLIRLINSQK